MDSTLSYLALNRQIGLARELDVIANNVANLATTGYRREGLVFAEFVRAAAPGDSISMADLAARFVAERPGEITLTGNPLDLAIEGPGFFTVRAGGEVLLTRAGNFQRSPEGLLVTADGAPVLDEAGGEIFLPSDAGAVTVARDGTISAGGAPLARLGLVTAAPEALERVGAASFRPREAPVPVENPRILHGALEGSNVDPLAEIARLIAVTRAYERTRLVGDEADRRVRDVIDRLARPA